MRILQLAIRSLQKYKLYTFLNILALGLSLTCVITLCRYIHQELNTDRFIKDLDRLYYTAQERKADQNQILRAVTGNKDFEQLIKNPAIEKVASFISLENDLIDSDNKKFRCDILVVDSSFLQIITYPILKTNVTTLLSRPDEAVITKKFAQKVFGNKDPVGEVIQHSSGKPVTITGVLDNPSTQVSIPFDLLIHRDLNSSWGRGFHEIVKLYPQVNPENINKLFSEYKKTNWDREEIRYQLHPLKDFYFNRHITFYYKPCIHGNITYLNILSIVVILLVIIGSFNFINTYTTLIIKREREFGMKKVFGVNPRQIYIQILFENGVMILAALFFAWIMNELFSGLLWNYMEVPEVKNYRFNMVLSFSILLVLPFFTSLYPFFRYRYSPPIHSLKQISASGETLKTRNSLLLFQYIITCSLVIISLTFIKQLHFMLNKDPGFRTENVLQASLLSNLSIFTPEVIKEYNSKKGILNNELSENTILKDYYFGKSPLDISDQNSLLRKPGEEYVPVKSFSISRKGIEFWGLTLLEGEFWEDREDYENQTNIMLNETAWKTFGFTNLEEAYLEAASHFIFTQYTDHSKTPQYKVVGVIRDFHTDHLAKKIPPVVFYYISDSGRDFFGEFNPERKQESIRYLAELNEKINDQDFSYQFFSDKVKALYKKDKQITLLCSLFTFFAICISALGLFSLALFDIKQKLPEVGIRKVNGAQPKDIFRLFMKKYMKILLYAFIIASVISWLGLSYYLQSFAYKAPISWCIFAIALLTTGGITWITLFYQIRKAAASNPAEVIKSE